MICLDTNAAIAIMSGRAPRVRERLEEAVAREEVAALPMLALHELWYGVEKSQRRADNIAVLSKFLGSVVILDFVAEDAEEAGEIRAALRRAGTPIGPYDVLIAAQARRRGAVLVTGNGREFSRVPGLVVEDWAAA